MNTVRDRGPRRLFRLVLVALVIFGAMAIQSPAVAREDGVYAKKTRHTLTGPFWGHWVMHDGPALLGLPVSEPLESGSELVQYFEYGVLTTRDERVQRARAGTLLRQEIESTDADAATPSVEKQAETDSKPPSKLVSVIKKYVSENGATARFGKEQGAPYVDGDVVVQWYTYGRIEATMASEPTAHHAQVGLELAQALGVKMDRVNRGGLETLDLERPGDHYFVGDGTVPEAAGDFDPLRIVIPAIGMDASIEQVNIINGIMGVPVDPWNVGWYQQLSAPGLTGNAVMAGHVDWWGIGPTVFANLASIQIDTKIYVVDENGEGATYTVTELESVSADTYAGDIVGATEIPTLTLITCTGAFDGAHYTSRLIVRAVRV